MVPAAVERLDEPVLLAEELLTVEEVPAVTPELERDAVWPCLLATLDADVLLEEETALDLEALAVDDDLVADVREAAPALSRTVEELLVPADLETAPMPLLRAEPVVVLRATCTLSFPKPNAPCPKWWCAPPYQPPYHPLCHGLYHPP